LPSRLCRKRARTRRHFLFSDVDAAIGRAVEVQEETVERMEEEGVDAAGDTGESGSGVRSSTS
jgi:hypothetical protein